LSICQLHILLSRTAQISLELHFCVELHTKKALIHQGVAATSDFASYKITFDLFDWLCSDIA